MLLARCIPYLQWPSGDCPVHQNWRAGYGQAGQRERPPGLLGGEDEDVSEHRQRALSKVQSRAAPLSILHALSLGQKYL